VVRRPHPRQEVWWVGNLWSDTSLVVRAKARLYNLTPNLLFPALPTPFAAPPPSPLPPQPSWSRCRRAAT
jgi:hypothetical protein